MLGENTKSDLISDFSESLLEELINEWREYFTTEFDGTIDDHITEEIKKYRTYNTRRKNEIN